MVFANFFDSHCHFDFAVFDDERSSIWASCQQAGIRHLLIPGVTPKQWSVANGICEQYPGIYSACGLHPWWVERDQLPEIEYWQTMLQHTHCVAIGECGLDKRISAPLARQEAIFEQHVSLAQSLRLPLIVHVRDAHNETIRILKRFSLPAGGVIHGFTGSVALAKAYWEMGFYLGVGGSITYSRARKTIETIESMPLDSLILETDAPDMPLSGAQGKANSPLAITRVASTLASIKNSSVQQVAEVTTKNSITLFGLMNS
ncbi:TatD family hydrolase [Eionea flava]